MDSERGKVVFLTNSEFGQSNVMLAVIHEFLSKDNEFDLHVASFHDLEPRLTQFLEENAAAYTFSFKNRVTFHLIPGPAMVESMPTDGDHPPGFHGALKSYTTLPSLIFPWSGSEYLEAVHSCMDILKTVNPVLTVVDVLFSQGRDALNHVGMQYMILSPLSLNDETMSKQPWGAMFWKYPALSSGYAYPVSWANLPANIFLNARLFAGIMSSPSFKKLVRARRDAELKGPMPVVEPFREHVPMLVSSLPELDMPCIIPSNVIGCGPILRPTRPVADVDPDLASWLQKGPTVMVNLGTNYDVTAKSAREMAIAFKAILDAYPRIRVIWKIKLKTGVTDDEVREILGGYMKSERLILSYWLVADPLSIMLNGNVVCSVNHGGANSYFEALSTGVPQVILPVWYDTYGWATKAEWLGHGIFANRTAAPSVKSGELTAGMKRTLDDESLKSRAKELGFICARAGGRSLAYKKITETARSLLSQQHPTGPGF